MTISSEKLRYLARTGQLDTFITSRNQNLRKPVANNDHKLLINTLNNLNQTSDKLANELQNFSVKQNEKQKTIEDNMDVNTFLLMNTIKGKI